MPETRRTRETPPDATAKTPTTVSKALRETLDLRIEAGIQDGAGGPIRFNDSYVFNVKASAGERCALEPVGPSCFVRRCAGDGDVNLLDMGKIHVGTWR